ncbi:MAG: hypothetical protein RLW62_08390 [Gammaproteobacteria bacterium]
MVDDAARAVSGGEFGDSLENAVRSAYTVIDEYMRRGCDAARYCQSSARWSDPMTEDPNQQFHQHNSWGPGWGTWGPAPQWMAQWSEALRVWSMLLSGAGQAAAVPPQWHYTPPKAYTESDPAKPSSSAPHTPAVPGVCVSVSSDRPTRVLPSVGAVAAGTKLTVDPLACIDGAEPSSPPITGTRIETDAEGTLLVSVVIIPEAPAGRYSGAVRTPSGDIVGGLTVILD